MLENDQKKVIHAHFLSNILYVLLVWLHQTIRQLLIIGKCLPAITFELTLRVESDLLVLELDLRVSKG